MNQNRGSQGSSGNKSQNPMQPPKGTGNVSQNEREGSQNEEIEEEETGSRNEQDEESTSIGQQDRSPGQGQNQGQNQGKTGSSQSNPGSAGTQGQRGRDS